MNWGRSLTDLLVLMLVLGILFQQRFLVLFCIWILLVVGVAHVWQRYALKRLSFERSLSETHVFPDSTVIMDTRLVNQKILPLTRVDLFDMLPKAINVSDAHVSPSGRPGKQSLMRSLSLGWYQAFNQRYEIQLPKRGLYLFGPTELRSGDPFGFFVVEAEVHSPARLIVYPRLINTPRLPQSLRSLFGSLRTPQHLLTDSTQTVGIRDYQPGDTLKAVHWPATARRGTLQTRVYQPATSLEWMCILDVSTFPHVWQGINPDHAEWLISLAATLCYQLTQAHHKVGLATNARAAADSVIHHLPPSNHPQHILHILETLAQSTPYAAMQLEYLLKKLCLTLIRGTTLLIVSARVDPAVVAVVMNLHKSGFPVVWVHSTPDAPAVPHIKMIYVAEESR